ncbi:hypothetical protein ACFL6O_02340 [candidate division KSB1 bacterium]
MKRYTLIITLVSCLIIVVNCSNRDTFTEQTVEGIRFIQNHEPAWNSNLRVSLELVNVYGTSNESDPNFQFFKPADITVDIDGCIYVLDAGNFRVQKYSHDWNYLDSFGRKGQGPGEFSRTIWLDTDSKKNIYIANIYNLIVLNSEGKEIHRRRSFKNRFDDLTILNSGDIAVNNLGDIKQENLVAIFDDSLDFVRGIGKIEDIPEGPFGMLYNSVKFVTDTEDNIYFSYISKNRIEKYDSKGNLIWRASRPLNFEPIEIDWGGTKSPPLISGGIGIDSKNRIWVLTFNRLLTYNDMYNQDVIPGIASYHIFNQEGILLGVIPAEQIRFIGSPTNCNIYGDRLFVINNVNMCIYEYRIVDN